MENDGERPSVLVIEDNDVFQSFLHRFLITKDIEVTLASNGLEGLEAIEKKHFDLIITDLKMPKMDGMEFLKNLRLSKKDHSTVIVLTAYGEMDNYVQALNWDVFEFLHKPVDIDVLSDIVGKAIKKNRMQSKD